MTLHRQTLEDLRKTSDPAWLWDVARARLVWANEAGLKVFEAQSLFDLIDRPFDASEPAFAEMAAVQAKLKREETARAALDFPSLSRAEPLKCECRLHTLADGRDGLLAVCRPEPAPVKHGVMLLDQLPIACLGLDDSGAVKLGNEQAFQLLGKDPPAALSSLVGEAQAATLLGRLKQTRLVSQVTPYASPFGQREARLTMRRLEGIKGLHALLVIEDVTERRELERQLSHAPAPDGLAPKPAAKPESKGDDQIFAELGRVLKDAAKPAVKAPDPAPAAKAAAAPAPPPAPAAPVSAPIAPAPATLKAEPAPDRDKASRAEADELRAILDICTDGIVTLDGQGSIKRFSAGAEAIFGFRSAEVMGKPFASLLGEGSAATFSEYLKGLSGEGLASVFNDGREVTGIVKQGGNVPLFLNLGRLGSSSDTYCAVLRDMTSSKLHEAELRAAKDSAEQASRHKTEFLANVSHELRTPLTAIIGFSEIIKQNKDNALASPKFRAYANDIHASGTQLLSMVDELLDMSKIESGKMELDFTAVNLPETFAAVQRLLQEQATRARVLIRKSFPDDLPNVVADQRAMRQVLTNLLSNAIKYTDAGGEVLVSGMVRETGDLLLRMQDTGIGMNAAELVSAMQPFARVETSGRVRQGTGLGLPLTRALVEANRATFGISSEPGKGTTVEITFPTTRVLAG